jgi:hypothetical protein
MNSKNRRITSRSVSSIIAAAAALFLAGTGYAAPIAKIQIGNADDIGFGFSAPHAVADASGNLHIVAHGWSTSSNSDREIYYWMVSKNGTLLIDATQINDANSVKETRPQIGLLSDGRAVIAWAYGGSTGVSYALIDPSAADQDGSPADTSDPEFLVVSETEVGVDTNAGALRLAIGSDGTAHVVKQTHNTLFYLSFDPTDGSGTPETAVADVERADAGLAMALDSNDNLHVAFQWDDPVDGLGPVAYMMIAGVDNGSVSAGDVLIDATPLYDETAVLQHAAHFSLVVDSRDRVLVVYGDKRRTVDFDSYCRECETGGDIYFTRLDPKLHAQDGSSATIADIRIGSELYIGNYWYAQAFRGPGGVLDIYATTGGEQQSNDGIKHVRVTPTSSGGRAGEGRIFDVHAVSATWSKHFVTSAGDWVVWTEGVFSPTLDGRAYPMFIGKRSDFAKRPVRTKSGAMELTFLAGLAALALLRRRMPRIRS